MMNLSYKDALIFILDVRVFSLKFHSPFSFAISFLVSPFAYPEHHSSFHSFQSIREYPRAIPYSPDSVHHIHFKNLTTAFQLRSCALISNGARYHPLVFGSWAYSRLPATSQRFYPFIWRPSVQPDLFANPQQLPLSRQLDRPYQYN